MNRPRATGTEASRLDAPPPNHAPTTGFGHAHAACVERVPRVRSITEVMPQISGQSLAGPRSAGGRLESKHPNSTRTNRLLLSSLCTDQFVTYIERVAGWLARHLSQPLPQVADFALLLVMTPPVFIQVPAASPPRVTWACAAPDHAEDRNAIAAKAEAHRVLFFG